MSVPATRHSRQSMIAAAHAWFDKHGAPPKAREWLCASYTHPSASAVRCIFGSWNAMIEAAGLTPRRACSPGRADWTTERVLAAVRLFEERNGRTPRTRDWVVPHVDYPNKETAIRRFGTWNQMLVAAGFEPRGKHAPITWTQDRIAAAFLDFLLREGHWPTTRQCDPSRDVRLPNRATVYLAFGSWTAAKLYAGWDPSAVAPKEFRCSGCGGDEYSETIGCNPCWDRKRHRVVRAAARNETLHVSAVESPPIGDSRASQPGRVVAPVERLVTDQPEKAAA